MNIRKYHLDILAVSILNVIAAYMLLDIIDFMVADRFRKYHNNIIEGEFTRIMQASDIGVGVADAIPIAPDG